MYSIARSTFRLKKHNNPDKQLCETLILNCFFRREQRVCECIKTVVVRAQKTNLYSCICVQQILGESFHFRLDMSSVLKEICLMSHMLRNKLKPLYFTHISMKYYMLQYIQSCCNISSGLHTQCRKSMSYTINIKDENRLNWFKYANNVAQD